MLVYVQIEKGVTLNTVTDASVAMFDAGITPVTCLPGTPMAREALQRCDAILYIAADQAENEASVFPSENLPVYDWPDLPERSPTEAKYPEQVEGFIKKIMGMYRVHLRKNEDYSPANIMGAGEIGIVTRLWDKMARLMNLSGFDVEVKSTSYREPKEPKHESIEDNAIDLANYAVIFQLYREGTWAK